MIRVQLPAHLRVLAQVDREVIVAVQAPVTPRAILNALESRFPMLRGCMRDQISQQRRPLVRFFACGEDWSQEPADIQLPDAVARGEEPFVILGAIAGGWE